jgi:hypothetical protein
MSYSWLFPSVIFGGALGWLLGTILLKKNIEEEKMRQRAKKAKRRSDTYERFRIEVKNNTVRMKKEEKRLALEKELVLPEFLYKNFKIRIHRITDKEILEVLHDFYSDLRIMDTTYKSYVEFSNINLTNNPNISGTVQTQLKDYFISVLINLISANIEKGVTIVSILEDKLMGD